MIDITKIRSDFPILSRLVNGVPLVYLDNAATSHKPASVIKSLVDYYENYNSNVHRGVHTLSMEATDSVENARSKIARFINAREPESIIWTRNTTESINIVARSWASQHLGPGDEIVTTRMEHHSNLVPWQQVARETGATIRFLEMTDDGSLDLSKVDSVISTKTKLLTLVHMSNSLGTINPVKELCAKARSVGATVLIDGAQSVPHMPVDVQDLDCDFLAFSGHKMLGPTGIGVLYAKQHLQAQMEPFLTGGEMVLQVSYEKATWNDLPMRFEAGTPNIADAIGLGAAVDYLENIGMDHVRSHEMDITRYALNSFNEIEELEVFGPLDHKVRGGVISFHSSDVHAHDFGTVLDQRGIAIRTGHHCTMPLMHTLDVAATARAGFYIYNTEEEVDLLVNAVKEALRYFVDGYK